MWLIIRILMRVSYRKNFTLRVQYFAPFFPDSYGNATNYRFYFVVDLPFGFHQMIWIFCHLDSRDEIKIIASTYGDGYFKKGSWWFRIPCYEIFGRDMRYSKNVVRYLDSFQGKSIRLLCPSFDRQRVERTPDLFVSNYRTVEGLYSNPLRVMKLLLRWG